MQGQGAAALASCLEDWPPLQPHPLTLPPLHLVTSSVKLSGWWALGLLACLRACVRAECNNNNPRLDRDCSEVIAPRNKQQAAQTHRALGGAAYRASQPWPRLALHPSPRLLLAASECPVRASACTRCRKPTAQGALAGRLPAAACIK